MANPVMIDLETLGTKPGSVVLSIGAVEFDPAEFVLGDEYYVEIDVDDSFRYGLRTDPDTVAWWGKQSEEARKVLAPKNPSKLIPALEGLNAFMAKNKGQTVWGCGSDFDIVLTRALYDAASMEPPWKFWEHRCYRTMKSVFSNVKPPKRKGTHHNALQDAQYQAEHLLEIYRHIRGG